MIVCNLGIEKSPDINTNKNDSYPLGTYETGIGTIIQLSFLINL